MSQLRQLLGLERRPGRMGWAFLVRPEGMEGEDRRFNKIFLAVFALVGATDLAAWVRTLTYCSNSQLSDPGSYSCPSSAHIVAIWACAGANVLSAFATRFLIMRKIRSLYWPVIALQLITCAVVLWLVTHHPHYGHR